MSADIRLLRWPDRDRDDFERLATALARVREVATRGRGEITAAVPAGPEEPSDLDRAKMLYAQRRERDAAAGKDAELFGDPAWDILLALFIANEEGREVDSDAIAALAHSLPSTTNRWIVVLETRGLVGGAVGARGNPIALLTDSGLTFMLRCLSGV